MRSMFPGLLAAFTLALAACSQQPSISGSTEQAANTNNANNAENAAASGQARERVVLELKTGKVLIELRPDLAPKHVERVKKLVGEKFYDGVIFHRVIPGFMAQTGDPTGTGTGGSEYSDLPAEFSTAPFERGTIGAARTSDPNTANSQFFITFTRTPHLNGQYTVWGKVVDGMTHVDAVAKGEPPPNPDKIIRMYMETAS